MHFSENINEWQLVCEDGASTSVNSVYRRVSLKHYYIFNNELNLQGTEKIQTETDGTETGKGTEIRMLGTSKNCLVSAKIRGNTSGEEEEH
jgi:hypothetical protein